MIAIHPIHRRLAELSMKARRMGGWRKLPPDEQTELEQCLRANEALVFRLDALKSLAFLAHTMDDFEWEKEICRKIDELEAPCW